MDIYAQNILTLKVKAPALFERLNQIKTNKTFEVFVDDNLSNANILDTRDNSIMYIKKPLEEIKEKLVKLKNFSQYRYLYFFGFGNGYLFKQLLKNTILKKITIIEAEVELIYIALNLIDFSQEILEDRLSIIYVDDLAFSSLFDSIPVDEKLYFKTYNLFLASDYYEKYYTKIIESNKIFLKVFSYYVNISGNNCFDEIQGLTQFLDNIPIMLKNPTLKELIHKAKTCDTAIIIATGPSLAKQLALLKKIQNKAVLISVDASLPILEKMGIKPDIVTSIERVSATALFYKSISKVFQKNIIFAITAVAHKNLLDSITEGTIQMSMRPTGSYYRFFNFDEWGYLGEGMSAGNMAFELATLVGFKRIVLIGQDLAYSKDGKSHSKDHIFGENEIENSKSNEFITAYGGNGVVKTTHAWKLFLNGYERKLKKLEQEKSNIVTINATEGGARIKGTIEIPFEKVIEKYLLNVPDKRDIKLILPTKIQYQKNILKAKNKLSEAIKLGTSMQKKVDKFLELLTREINNSKNFSYDDSNKALIRKKMYFLLSNLYKIRTKYYDIKFQSFFTYLIAPLVSHIEFDIAKIMVLPENTEEEKLEKQKQILNINHEWLLRISANLYNILKILKKKSFGVK